MAEEIEKEADPNAKIDSNKNSSDPDADQTSHCICQLPNLCISIGVVTGFHNQWIPAFFAGWYVLQDEYRLIIHPQQSVTFWAGEAGADHLIMI